MGKGEEGRPPPALPASTSEAPDGAVADIRNGGRLFRPRCVVTVVVGLAVVLSVVFWLPPFFRHEGGSRRDRDRWFRADIVASFRLQKPVGMLKGNVEKLRYDIYEEIGVPGSSVSVISLDQLGGSNWTNVIFGIWPYPEKSLIPPTSLSLLRSSFMSLVIQQSTLHLTTTLFGNSSRFEVLKFPGGITIVPLQNAFLLQKLTTLFNFTLNFPIYQVQDKLAELQGQMKSGLLLNSNEIIYFRLTNLEGSTVAPPTIVQTSIVLAVGNPPSLPRLKQLAQNIRNSSAGNLGLNHTVFGRVKQIQLSSYLQHSLNTSNHTGSPSPSPQPSPDYHYHQHRHHHHHHHHHHHEVVRFPPLPAPAPDPASAPAPAQAHAPAPEKTPRALTPSRCLHGFSKKPRSKGFSAPSAAPAARSRHLVSPMAAPHASAPVASSFHHSPSPSSRQKSSPVSSGSPLGLISPPLHNYSPAPKPNSLSAPPFPVVSFSHAQPPSVADDKPPDIMPARAPAPHPSLAPEKYIIHWVLASMLYVILSL